METHWIYYLDNGFLIEYMEKGILDEDPFAVAGKAGVGKLMRIAVEEGISVNKKLEFGICGEHCKA
jgi:pyruvate, orthophosphate dikinase